MNDDKKGAKLLQDFAIAYNRWTGTRGEPSPIHPVGVGEDASVLYEAAFAFAKHFAEQADLVKKK